MRAIDVPEILTLKLPTVALATSGILTRHQNPIGDGLLVQRTGCGFWTGTGSSYWDEKGMQNVANMVHSLRQLWGILSVPVERRAGQPIMSSHSTKIHPTAEVSPQAIIGAGTSIWHQAQVRERAIIGRNCILGKGVYVDYDVRVGDNCKLQNGVYIYHPTTVEDGVFFGPGVIVTNDKVPRAVNPDMTLKSDADWKVSPVWIGQGAALGAGSVLLPGVRVGRWAMVGAGAVVTRDIPDFGLVVGNPARVIGYVCRCGHRLEQDAAGAYTCRRCGTQYDNL